MAARWIEKVTGSFAEKKRYRAYKARCAQLPASYRTAIEGLDRYLMYAGAITRGDVLVQMMEDLVTLFEESAAEGSPVRAVVGEDPVSFAEDFLANYSEARWISAERARLVGAIEQAATLEAEGSGR